MAQPGVEVTYGLGGTSRVLEPKDLYVDAPGRPELLVKAQGLIVTGIERLQAARQHIIDNDDPVDADYHVTLFQGDLPELFYFSASIEGFSTLVVAIHDALRHREGEFSRLSKSMH